MTEQPKPKVLVVDDTPKNITAIKKILESLDVEVIAAYSGNEALSLLLRHQFAVILLDVEMPGMDGFETAELMMQIEETRYIPIIFVTAMDKDQNFVFKGYEVGGVDYVFKPFNPEVLKSKISVFLNLYRQKETLKEHKNRLTLLLDEKENLIQLVEEQNKKKDELLYRINEQQQKINKYFRFKLWISGAVLTFLAIATIFYLANVSKQNSQLIAYTKELNAVNDYANRLNNAYKRFIPYDILNMLNRESIMDVQLGDQVLKEMVVMFVDVRGYSAIAEALTPQENIGLINEILQIMQRPVMKHGGIINKYLGDGLMALFGTDTDDAMKASILMMKNLNEYSQKRIGKGLSPIKVGIGIDGGLMMVGTVGSDDRMEHTVVADAVNVASRIEGMTKMYGASLLISEFVYEHLKDPSQYHIRLMDIVKVQGREKPVIVYQVLDGECEATIELHKKTAQNFSEGILLYHEKKCAEALHSFKRVLEINPDDMAAKTYCERCAGYLKNPGDDEWSHVRKLLSK